jgi:hypothetical protein
MTKDLDKKVAYAMELHYERGFIDGMQKQMQRTWVDLTDEEIDNINYTSAHMLAREVLAKFKEKNT